MKTTMEKDNVSKFGIVVVSTSFLNSGNERHFLLSQTPFGAIAA